MWWISHTFQTSDETKKLVTKQEIQLRKKKVKKQEIQSRNKKVTHETRNLVTKKN